jgi:hypothetical protein
VPFSASAAPFRNYNLEMGYYFGSFLLMSMVLEIDSESMMLEKWSPIKQTVLEDNSVFAEPETCPEYGVVVMSHL